MSMELYVALPTRDPITVETLVESGRQVGLDLAFDPDVVFEEARGFQPGALGGERTGVEIDFFEPAADPELTELFDGTLSHVERIVAFRWGSDHLECAFAMAVAAALVNRHQGVCFEPEEGVLLPLDRIVAGAHDAVTWAPLDSAEAD